MDSLDWGELMALDEAKIRTFVSERFFDHVFNSYREVVLDPNKDNERIKSAYLQSSSPRDKMTFLNWLGQFEERKDSPVDHKEILRFMMHMAYSNELYASKMTLNSNEG